MMVSICISQIYCRVELLRLFTQKIFTLQHNIIVLLEEKPENAKHCIKLRNALF